MLERFIRHPQLLILYLNLVDLVLKQLQLRLSALSIGAL